MRSVNPSIENLIVLASNWLIEVYEELDEDVVRRPLEKFWETQDLAYVEDLCDLFITMADYVTAEDVEYFRDTAYFSGED